MTTDGRRDLVHRLRVDVERLATPRAAGTAAEAAARAHVEERLRTFGLPVTETPVTYDPWMIRTGLSIVLACVALALLWAVARPHRIEPLLAALLLGIPVVVSVGWGWPRWDSGTRVRSANVVASHGSTPRLWVVAHVDSKSQHLSFVARTACAAGAVAGLAAFGLARLGGDEFGVVASIAGGLSAVLIGALAWSGHGNDSPGANDNATGVAVLIEVANRLRHRSDVGYLVTTGEEDGLVGADRFARQFPPTEPRPMILNLDTVGRSPLLVTGHRWRRGRDALSHAVHRAARSAGIPARKRVIPFPAAVDSFVFHRAGHTTLTLAGGTVRSTYRHLHRPSDTIDRVDFEWLAHVVGVIEHAIAEVVDGDPTGTSRG